MQSRPVSLLAFAAAFALSAFGQANVSFSGSTNSAGVMQGTMHLTPRRYPGPVIAGAPYSAQRVSEHVQTAADGTRFVSGGPMETLYRDSQGRTRTERPIIMRAPGGGSAPDSPQFVEIDDPVANLGYILDTQQRIAHRYRYETPAVQPHVAVGIAATGVGGGGSIGAPNGVVAALATIAVPAAANSGGPPRPDITHEDLGTQMVEGVMATGTRNVLHWPAGTQGSDRPYQTTNEVWTSDDLKLMILSKNSDPQSGENTMKLTNISRAVPDAALFAPPPDYQVVDETGPFTINWTGQR